MRNNGKRQPQTLGNIFRKKPIETVRKAIVVPRGTRGDYEDLVGTHGVLIENTIVIDQRHTWFKTFNSLSDMNAHMRPMCGLAPIYGRT